MFYTERFQYLVCFGGDQIISGDDNIPFVYHALCRRDIFHAGFYRQSCFGKVVFQIRVNVVVQAHAEDLFLGCFREMQTLYVFYQCFVCLFQRVDIGEFFLLGNTVLNDQNVFDFVCIELFRH